jgi:hypothetical protein
VVTRLGCGITLSVTALGGCAMPASEQDVSRVAAQFLEAAGHADGAAACALLTPKTRDDLAVSQGQPCAESLPMDRIQGAPREASVWSTWARVSTDKGSLFLTEFDSGWLVTAAGCEANGDAPYHCVVGG